METSNLKSARYPWIFANTFFCQLLIQILWEFNPYSDLLHNWNFKIFKKEIFYVYKLILMFQYEISVSDYMHYPRMNSHHHVILKVNITLRTCTNFQNLLVYSDDMLNWSILDIVYYTYFHLFKLIKLIRIFKKIIIANTT